MKFKHLNSIIIFILLCVNLNAQNFNYKIYLNAGLIFSGGTTINRIGLFASSNIVYRNVQMNLRIQPIYNITSIGAGIESSELQANVALLLGYGKHDEFQNNFITQLSNQTGRKNSIAFGYNAYFDNIETSQFTGTVAFEFNHWGFIHENDMWGEKLSDRFRSAGIKLYYRTELWNYSTNIILWHGNAFAKETKRVTDSDYPARFGYKDFTSSKYGRFSHGIWTAQINYLLPNKQILNFDIGIDSEKVRNFVQNKLIHDMILLPDKLVVNHILVYPMIDQKGKAYLYKPNQKIKKSELFFNFACNQNLFY